MPLQPRHEYAADLPHGLRTSHEIPAPESPSPPGTARTASWPTSTRFEPMPRLRGFNHWFALAAASKARLPPGSATRYDGRQSDISTHSIIDASWRTTCSQHTRIGRRGGHAQRRAHSSSVSTGLPDRVSQRGGRNVARPHSSRMVSVASAQSVDAFTDSQAAYSGPLSRHETAVRRRRQAFGLWERGAKTTANQLRTATTCRTNPGLGRLGRGLRTAPEEGPWVREQ